MPKSNAGGRNKPGPSVRKTVPTSQAGQKKEEIDMNHPALMKVYNKYKRTDLPEFEIGDTIKVHVKIKEGDKERTQAFEGVVIARKNTGMGENIVVRKMSFGTGIERIFPINAPVIDRIDVIRTGKVRRAKLYYLRNLRGKAARLKERV